MKTLQQGKAVHSSSALACLRPWQDEDGLLRVDGRTRWSEDLKWDTKFPVILPRQHAVTRLLVKEAHEKAAHGGVNLVLARLREKYWILAAREIISEMLRRCNQCRRLKAVPAQQVMAPLPTERTSRSTWPFQKISVDMAGPFLTIQGRGKPRRKRYIALFDCLAIRAIHIEVVTAMDVTAFMHAFTRMTARRGCPEEIWSDQGSNFVAASKELKELTQELSHEEVRSLTAIRGVKWRFHPPAAPHFSGVHEALIKAAKSSFKKIVLNADVTDEELQTVFTNIEGILNSRPLSYQSADGLDIVPLTPNDFLISRSNCQVLPPEASLGEKGYRQCWRRVQEIADHFWQRWLLECVPALNVRSKWRTMRDNLKEGKIVVLVEADQERGRWPLGRITKVFPGQDGCVRTVDVLVRGKVYRRPIVKICPLRLTEE